MKKFIALVLSVAAIVAMLFAGINGGGAGTWMPTNTDAFCRDWLHHAITRGHIAELGGDAAAITLLGHIANQGNVEAWGNQVEVVVAVKITGKTIQLVLADSNPTIFVRDFQRIKDRASNLSKIKDLAPYRQLFATCRQVWERALAPRPVPAQAPAPAKVPVQKFELEPVPVLVLVLGGGIVLLLGGALLLGGKRMVTA